MAADQLLDHRPTDISYCVCYGLRIHHWDQLVRAAGSRWATPTWYRHITLSGTAAAFLVITRHTAKSVRRPRREAASPDVERKPSTSQVPCYR